MAVRQRTLASLETLHRTLAHTLRGTLALTRSVLAPHTLRGSRRRGGHRRDGKAARLGGRAMRCARKAHRAARGTPVHRPSQRLQPTAAAGAATSAPAAAAAAAAAGPRSPAASCERRRRRGMPAALRALPVALGAAAVRAATAVSRVIASRALHRQRTIDPERA